MSSKAEEYRKRAQACLEIADGRRGRRLSQEEANPIDSRNYCPGPHDCLQDNC